MSLSKFVNMSNRHILKIFVLFLIIFNLISTSMSYGVLDPEQVTELNSKSQKLNDNKFDIIPDEVLKIILKHCLKHNNYLNQFLCFDRCEEDITSLSHRNYLSLLLVNKRFNSLQKELPYFTATRYSFNEPFDVREIQNFPDNFWKALNILNISVYSEFSDLNQLFKKSFTTLKMVSLLNALPLNNLRTTTNLFDHAISQLTVFLQQNNKIHHLKITDFNLKIDHLKKFKNITHLAFSAHQLGLLELQFLLEEMPLKYLQLKNTQYMTLNIGDKKNTTLKHLKFDHSIHINIESLKNLVFNYSLYELRLDVRKMNLEHVRLLTQSTSIRSLSLNNGHFGWQEYDALAQNTSLKHLNLDGTKFRNKDTSRQFFSKLTYLSTLSLKDTDLEEDNAQELLKLPNLTSLDVTNNADAICDRGVDELYESDKIYDCQLEAIYGPALSLNLCQKLESLIKNTKHDYNTKKPLKNRHMFEDLYANLGHD